MKKCSHLLPIVILVPYLAVGISGCDDQTTSQIDNMINGGAETPTIEPTEPIQGMVVTDVNGQALAFTPVNGQINAP